MMSTINIERNFLFSYIFIDSTIYSLSILTIREMMDRIHKTETRTRNIIDVAVNVDSQYVTNLIVKSL